MANKSLEADQAIMRLVWSIMQLGSDVSTFFTSTKEGGTLRTSENRIARFKCDNWAIFNYKTT
jgi:hypothetical protein